MTLEQKLPIGVRKKALEQIFPEADPYAGDPVKWVHDRLRGFLWSKQRQILESVRDNRFTAVPSCHGPGKSYTASCAAAAWIDSHPPGEAIVVTTAPTDHQVKAILWKEISRRRREAKPPIIGRITLEAKWYKGERMVDEELIGFGRKPQDYDTDAFQGIHEKYVLVIVDEAGGVPKGLMDALETLITNEYGRMLAIGNPDDPSSHFETICRPGSGWVVIPISVWDTPNFTGEPVPKHISERLVSKMWVEERRNKWGEGSPLWISKVEGKFPEITDDTLISPSWIRRAQAKKIQPAVLGVDSWDVARLGPDETVGYSYRNGHLREIASYHKQTTDVTAAKILFHVARHSENWVPVVVDVIGLGAGVVDILRGIHNLDQVVPFNGSEKPIDEKRFANKRAECYWFLRELFENDNIDIDERDDRLAAQLGSIKWGIDKWGRIYIESKDDMRRRGLPSPDRADGAMMAVSLDVLHSAPTTIVGETITSDLLTLVM